MSAVPPKAEVRSGYWHLPRWGLCGMMASPGRAAGLRKPQKYARCASFMLDVASPGCTAGGVTHDSTRFSALRRAA